MSEIFLTCLQESEFEDGDFAVPQFLRRPQIHNIRNILGNNGNVLCPDCGCAYMGGQVRQNSSKGTLKKDVFLYLSYQVDLNIVDFCKYRMSQHYNKTT